MCMQICDGIDEKIKQNIQRLQYTHIQRMSVDKVNDDRQEISEYFSLNFYAYPQHTLYKRATIGVSLVDR